MANGADHERQRLNARAKDREYWARLHVKSDKAKAVKLSDPRSSRCVARGGGTRYERGGFKFEEKE